MTFVFDPKIFEISAWRAPVEKVTIIHEIHTLRIILRIITHAKRIYNIKNKIKNNN